MPYAWTPTNRDDTQELRLWPHNSLTPKGLAFFVLSTFTLLTLPLLAVLGTTVMWGMLPFLMLALFGAWFAIRKNRRDRQISEVLTLTSDDLHLIRQSGTSHTIAWRCNKYWAKVSMYENEGPVPRYVTLKGNGREVEIGSFLSEDERNGLFEELSVRLRQIA